MVIFSFWCLNYPIFVQWDPLQAGSRVFWLDLLRFFFFFWFCRVLVAAHGLLSCSRRASLLRLAGSLVVAYELLVAACVWDLVPWPGIKPRPPALGAWSLNHCTTREDPDLLRFWELPCQNLWQRNIPLAHLGSSLLYTWEQPFLQ